VRVPASIPILLSELFLATSVYVECIFSKGRILLSHLRSRLSVQSTRALLCIGNWSLLGLVKAADIKRAVSCTEIEEEECDEDVEEGWDYIFGRGSSDSEE
jgi:hypothetical protein